MSKQRIKANFSRAALQYDAHAQLQQEVAGELFQQAIQHFPKRGLILDAGCGTGILHRLVQKYQKNWRLIQYDLAEGMCRFAKIAATDTALTVNGEVECLPFKDGKLDGIFSSLTLQWVKNPIVALQEMKRVLKQGRYCVISTFGANTLYELQQSFAKLDGNKHMMEFADKHSLFAAMKEAGFSDVTVTSKPYILHYTDSLTLIRSMKAIGANDTGGKHHYLGKQYFAKLESVYQQHYGTEHGIPATWEVITLTGKA